jgi:hypothetical protein
VDGSRVRGIVHRDISPHNVLVSWNGAVKVSDFGLAKARAASNASASAIVKGKPAYMSPEQAQGQELDGRSDLFSVGVMLWEMLCQRSLFAAETIGETIAHVLAKEIPVPHKERREVPEDLSRVVMSLLARDRQRRPANAEAAIAVLVACADYPRDGREVLVATLAQRFVGRAPVRARGSVPPHVEPLPVVPLPPEARTLTAQSAVRIMAHSRRWPWVLLAAFVVAMTTVGALLVTHHTSEAATPAVSGSAPAAQPVALPPAPSAEPVASQPAAPAPTRAVRDIPSTSTPVARATAPAGIDAQPAAPVLPASGIVPSVEPPGRPGAISKAGLKVKRSASTNLPPSDQEPRGSDGKFDRNAAAGD